MRKHWRVIVFVAVFLTTASYALSQTNPPIVQWQAIINLINNIQAQLNALTAQVNNSAGGKSLTFGGTTIPTNSSAPVNGNYLCIGSTTITGCSAPGACGGLVTLSGGTGTFSAACVTATSNCNASDTTHYNNPITTSQPVSTAVSLYNGVGSDVVRVSCQ